MTLCHVVPDSLLVHIGDITVSFACLEDVLRMLIGSLIAEHQRVGQIVTAELSFRQLRALAISLYKEHLGADDDYENMRALMKKIGCIEEKRNQITHSMWAAGGAPDSITRVKTTAKEAKGLSFQFTTITKSELEAIASEIKAIAHETLEFLFSLVNKKKAVNNPIEKPW